MAGKQTLCAFSLLLLCISLLAGCTAREAASPDQLQITSGGTVITLLEVTNGSDPVTVRAELLPAGYEGVVQWSSEDPGIVKADAGEDGSCELIFRKTGSVRITASCGDASAVLRVRVLKNQDNLSALDTAIRISDRAYSSESCRICLADMYYKFVDAYGAYAAYYGLDTSAGIRSLASQTCDYSSDGTWLGYFLDNLASQLLQVQALCDYAAQKGIVLSEEELLQIDEQLAALEALAQDNGTTLDAYLVEYYGKGASEALYRRYLEEALLADKVYSSYAENLSFTDEELEAHFEQMGYSGDGYGYPLTAMRHILILAEESDDGTYTDAALEAAHRRVEEIRQEWLDGDCTEESFAQLAEQYSQDSGSNTVGGLYEDIYKGEMVEGIDDWLFDESRVTGDTAVIDNNGSYVGTHLVYFSGSGELYSHYIARSDLEDTALTEWFSGITGCYEAQQGSAYEDISNF